MQKGKKITKSLGAVLLAISIMGVLYGWVAYAATTADSPDSPIIDHDVGAVAQTVLTGSPVNTPPPQQTSGGVVPPLPPGIMDVAKQFMSQISEMVESVQNGATQTDFYGTGIEVDKAMVARHFSRYCAGPEVSGGSNCPADPLLQFGDVKFSSIITGTAYNDPNGLRAQAAQDYLTNLFVPPAGALVSNFQGDLKEGQLDIATIMENSDLLKKYTKALSDETLLSIPRQSFAEMIARRTITGTDAGSISEMQLMEAEAIKRFMSASWIQATKNPNTPAIQIQQEMAIMQAYQNWMAYQQFQQLERIEALLAGLIVQNIRTAQALAASIPTAPATTVPAAQ